MEPVYRLPPNCQWCKLTGISAPRTGKFAPVTLGHMRWQGCRDLLIYCIPTVATTARPCIPVIYQMTR
jgi:hypothetical protein